MLSGLGEIKSRLLFGRAIENQRPRGAIMKRYGNLFEKTFNMENLYRAYLDARKGKRSRRSCYLFGVNLGKNLEELREEIHSGTYRPRPYYKFIVYEPKQRVIYAPAFRDVVVQHAVYRVIYGIFDAGFIDQSFACRLGYGTHKASLHVQAAMRKYSGELYTLKLDVRKFFYRIDRAILRDLIGRKIKDARLAEMMMRFAEIEEPVGIPIGNLLSQIYALIYLNPLDHFIKRELKIRDYCRYVDDLVLVGLTRDECLAARARIEEYLKENLHLELSKSTIQKIRKGVNFCGYRTWRSCRFVRKHSLYKFKRSVKSGWQDSVNSLLGHANNTNSLCHMLNILKGENRNGSKNFVIPKNYRPLYYALPN